jgi:asparagine synthase (glutamine-hydrolysing)
VADGKPCELDSQALYDYLHFHVIPAPRTAFVGIHRLQASHSLMFEDGELTTTPHWKPRFDEKDRTPLKQLVTEFRNLVDRAVQVEANEFRVGCFLSGGTDSSAVVGTLRAVTGRRPRTFSIGFDAQGYDEMAYARITARHFDTEHHEHYLTPQELLDAIPKVAGFYDQPFGNSSALPTYYCALLAKEAGVDKMLAGDGGDELFGGNTRYARQKILAAYERLPRTLRKTLLEPMLLSMPETRHVPFLRKCVSYIRQARTPMPDRMNSYNLLQRIGPRQILTEDFLSGIDLQAPAEHEHLTYAALSDACLLNRMLAYDWKYTLADNDLPKVTGTTSLAGVGVGFPLLADEIVDFSTRLRPELKVRGLKLRYFFKEACRGFLPDETIRKQKHGFGLPFGIWLTKNSALHAMAGDALEALARRAIVRRPFVEQLINRKLSEHPTYYGELIWILMMLEHWLANSKIEQVRSYGTLRA